MKKQLYITTVLLTIILFYSSCKRCSDGTGNTYNVNQADLPYIIPYSDTSKVRFLKNGTDTLTFISQGLKNTYLSQTMPDDGCSHTDKLQQYSLMMKCNESEFFEIEKEINYASINVNNSIYKNLYGRNYYVAGSNPTGFFVDTITINNIKYDSLNKLFYNSSNYVIAKSKVGLIEMVVNGQKYELIK
jgi:hypothetical protein